MKKKHDLDRLASALESLDQIDADLSVVRRVSAADVVCAHIEKISAARDRGYSVAQIAGWLAMRAGCSSATVKTAISRALMNRSDARPDRKKAGVGSPKNRPAVKSTISLGAAVTSSAAPPPKQPVSAPGSPVLAAAVQPPQQPTTQSLAQPGAVNLSAIVSNLSAPAVTTVAQPLTTTGASTDRPVAQQVA